MIVVGDFTGSGEIPLHFDSNDYINAIVSIGDKQIIGGNTVYYDGTTPKKPGTKIREVKFQHGRIQIGYFDDIIHGATSWIGGIRGVLNFCVKKNSSFIFSNIKTLITNNSLMLAIPEVSLLQHKQHVTT